VAEPALRWRREAFELDPPLVTARGRWQRRVSLRVELRDPSGLVGLGEAAPLPGYSLDTLEGSEAALSAVSAAELADLARLELPGEVPTAVARVVPAEQPAARFALETALLHRLSLTRGCPLWQTLREGLAHDGVASAREVPVCALLSALDPERALREAARQLQQGVRCFKLKIGPGRLLPAQAGLLGALRAAWGDQIELRLDANQSLERSSLRATFTALAAFRPQFIEEPVEQPRPEDLADLGCGWALDESLQQLDGERLSALTSVRGWRALVLKPSALGGFGRCIALAARARAAGGEVLVSHTLEGPLGWLACAHLAFALSPGGAAGLWPMAHPGEPPLQVAAGRLPLPHQPGLGALV
jgi:o-succinylbenzoate synthase